MPRDARLDILLEPVTIGPKVTRNRFYQVPHCNGMGYRDPSAVAAMRGVKAEGGWGVVCSEQVEIHPSSEITPFIELRLWDDRDLPAHERIVQAIQAHGSLAGIELCHNGMNGPNLTSREVPMGPAHLPVVSWFHDPIQARAMDKADIADLRRWHKAAALRARRAGYDLVYVYAGHTLSTLQHFLSPRFNDRIDEYGGSLANRARLLREVIEDTKEAIGDSCAVAVRLAMDEGRGPDGLGREAALEVIAMLAELPDLWDVCLAPWENDSQTSRFQAEAGQEPFAKGVKRLTTKPVVGVGRFTSPDTMARMVREGVLDLIGAARPSIADPFLPRKIEEGRLDDIRECIGCNICVTGDFSMSPVRCTQNPSMGEEWRRGWHPERLRPARRKRSLLIVGAGPAGLECAQAAGKRGYEVTLAEARRDLGGRVALESRLPGLAAWARVRSWRETQIAALTNVEVFRESRMTAADVQGFGADHVVLATGAAWRSDGVGRHHTRPLPLAESAELLTPDDIMAGRRPKGRRVLIYDDDHYYMANVLAELLHGEGYALAYLTPASEPAAFTRHTMEQHRIHKRLLEIGADLRCHHALAGLDAGGAVAQCTLTGREVPIEADTVLLVTARLPDDQLLRELDGRGSATAIGDARAPATIAHAVYAGRRLAEELDEPRADGVPFRREIAELLDDPPSIGATA